MITQLTLASPGPNDSIGPGPRQASDMPSVGPTSVTTQLTPTGPGRPNDSTLPPAPDRPSLSGPHVTTDSVDHDQPALGPKTPHWSPAPDGLTEWAPWITGPDRPWPAQLLTGPGPTGPRTGPQWAPQRLTGPGPTGPRTGPQWAPQRLTRQLPRAGGLTRRDSDADQSCQ